MGAHYLLVLKQRSKVRRNEGASNKIRVVTGGRAFTIGVGLSS